MYQVVEVFRSKNPPPPLNWHVEKVLEVQPSGKATNGWLPAVDTKTVRSWAGDPT